MVLTRRYLDFVEKKKKLPRQAKLNLQQFFNEICVVESSQMEDALRWMKSQKNYDEEKIADAFFVNYLASSSENYFTMAKCCDSLVPNFKDRLRVLVEKTLKELFGKWNTQPEDEKLLKIMHLVNGLYAEGMLPSENIFTAMCSAMDANMDISLRIDVVKKLITKNVTQSLKQDCIDERFLACCSLIKTKIALKIAEKLTLVEISQVLKALEEVHFCSFEQFQRDKIDVAEDIILRWCNGSCNLKKTLADFSALQLKHSEQFGSLSLRIYALVRKAISIHKKLAVLLSHLKNGTSEDQGILFVEKLIEITRFSLKTYCTNIETIIRLKGHDIFFRYLCALYNRCIIESDMIVTPLNNFIALSNQAGSLLFAEIFTIVDKKLKKDISEKDFRKLFDHMMKTVIGNREATELPQCSQDWLKKVKMEEEKAAAEMNQQKAKMELKSRNTFSKLQDQVIEQKHIAATLEGCSSATNAWQALKQFEKYKNAAKNILAIIPKEFVAVALSKTELSVYLVVLLKKLFEGTFKHRSQELCENLFNVLQREAMKHSSKGTLKQKFNFLNLLSQLFFAGVTDEKLLIEGFGIFRKNLSDNTQTHLAQKIFEEFYKRLEYKVSSETFHEIGRLLPDGPAQDKFLGKTRIEVIAPDHVPKQMQSITFNLQGLECPKKLNKIVDSLKTILNTGDRMEIFITHMLGRRKVNLMEILLQSKLLVELTKLSDDKFKFKDCLTSTIHAEYLRTNAIANFNKKTTAKLNRIELISGELWRNKLMATKKFASLLMSKNMRLLPTESLAHLSMIVEDVMYSEGNSKLKLAVRLFGTSVHESTIKALSHIKKDLEDLETRLRAMSSYIESSQQ